jgi:DNA mismatch repair protein MSH5
LFYGLIKSLLNRGPHCPKVIAATHFHEVFVPGMLDPLTTPATFLHMRVVLTTSSGELLNETDEENDADMEHDSALTDPRQKLVYLYR